MSGSQQVASDVGHGEPSDQVIGAGAAAKWVATTIAMVHGASP
jgi:hypothetical protein